MKLPRRISEMLHGFNSGDRPDPADLKAGFRAILTLPDSRERDALMGSLLMGLTWIEPSVEEMVAIYEAALSIDAIAPPVPLAIDLPAGGKIVGIAGSGKKGCKTVNISTPSMLVAASLGAYIAKPGSSSTSSVCGSSDLMKGMGARLDLPLHEMAAILEETGVGFFEIESQIPQFDRVYGGLFHTVNLMSFGFALLTSPVATDSAVFGIAHANVELAVRVLQRFGIENVMGLSCSHDGVHFIDEIGVFGTTQIINNLDGKVGTVRHFDPAKDLGLPSYGPHDVAQGATLEESIRLTSEVLSGKGREPMEDIVCINAAAMLCQSDLVSDLREGFDAAKDAVRGGRPYWKLREFVDATQRRAMLAVG